MVLLKIGNFLNSGTNRGRAIGFKLDLLSKIGDVQSASKLKKMTLFQFFVQNVKRKNPKLMVFLKELVDLQTARNVSPLIDSDRYCSRRGQDERNLENSKDCWKITRNQEK